MVVPLAFHCSVSGQVSTRMLAGSHTTLLFVPLRTDIWASLKAPVWFGSEVSKCQILMSCSLGGTRTLEIPWDSGLGICAGFLADMGEFFHHEGQTYWFQIADWPAVSSEVVNEGNSGFG